jgi:REP-associated tyrosine transposase
MPRKPRIHVVGGIYHVILRGNARGPIFFREQDRDCLNDLMADGLRRYDCRVHAFCWMTNHLHVAIQVADRPLSTLMCWLAASYARHINRSLGRSGHLFERRHRAELVVDDEYLLNLVRYIHFNPVNAGMVGDPGDYIWSSHRAYLGVNNFGWLTTRAVLSCFGESLSTARHQYRVFMSCKTDWTPGADGRAHNEQLDARALSSVDRKSENYRQRIGGLVEKYCAAAEIEPAALSAPGRQRVAARLRALISNDALRHGDATMGELAYYFGRSPEVISRGIKRYC